MTCKINRRDCKYCNIELNCQRENFLLQGIDFGKGKCNEITKENFKQHLLKIESEFGFLSDSIFVF
jgi:hypothetical protein